MIVFFVVGLVVGGWWLVVGGWWLVVKSGGVQEIIFSRDRNGEATDQTNREDDQLWVLDNTHRSTVRSSKEAGYQSPYLLMVQGAHLKTRSSSINTFSLICLAILIQFNDCG